MSNLLEIYKTGIVAAFLNESPDKGGTSVEDLESDAEASSRFLMSYTSKELDEDVNIFLVEKTVDEIIISFVRENGDERKVHIPQSGEFDCDFRYLFDYWEPHIYLNANGVGYMDGCESIEQMSSCEWDGVIKQGKPSKDDEFEITWPTILEIFTNESLLNLALSYSNSLYEKPIDSLFNEPETRIQRWSLSFLFESFFLSCDWKPTAKDSPVTMKYVEKKKRV